MKSGIRWGVIWRTAAITLWLAPAAVWAQESIEPQQSAEGGADEALEASPNRPSSSNSADVLKPGVLQWEYGFAKEWGASGDRQSAIGGELRFGVMRNLEFRWGGDSLTTLTTDATQTRGFGDQYFSGQYRFLRETKKRPALAVSYAIKVPTAKEALGLGSGRVDHSWTFLASKEIGKFTCDFNAGYQLVGKEGTTGYDSNGIAILTFQRTVYRKLSAIGEIGAESRLGAQAPAFATTLWALTYQLHRQVVIDGGIDVGITPGAPHKRILFGLTYAIANLYGRR